jgi:hypothetical protein
MGNGSIKYLKSANGKPRANFSEPHDFDQHRSILRSTDKSSFLSRRGQHWRGLGHTGKSLA